MDRRRHVAIRGGVLTAVSLLLGLGGRAEAGCLSLISGPVVFDVQGCKAMEPESYFDTAKPKYSWIAGLDAAGRKTFFNSYRGLYLRGKIVKSQAVAKGINPEQGALAGETVGVYINPGKLSCQAVNGKRVASELRETCCDGGGDVPCLLGTGYVLASPSVIGNAGSAAGDNTRQKAKDSKDVQAAEKLEASGKTKDAIKLYERARTNGELDVGGLYALGSAYRKIDECNNAVPPLKAVLDMSQKKQVFADDEPTARKAIFLLARCYAKMNDPGPAVLLLQGYLLEPQKYKVELQESLSHKDFGWIKTSKEYREYKVQAQKKLKNS